MLCSSTAQDQHAANELTEGLNVNNSVKNTLRCLNGVHIRNTTELMNLHQEQTHRPPLVPQTSPSSFPFRCLQSMDSRLMRSGTDCNRAPPRACLADSPTMHWGWRLTSCSDLRSAAHRNLHSQLKLTDAGTCFIIATDSI